MFPGGVSGYLVSCYPTVLSSILVMDMFSCLSGFIRCFKFKRRSRDRNCQRTHQIDSEQGRATDVDYCPYGVFNTGK